MSRVLLISANRERLPGPVVPLGVLSVAASLRRHQYDVAVADLCFEPDAAQAVTAAIARNRPDVVGVGIRNLHTNAYTSSDALIDGYREICSAVRTSTRAPLMVGGAGFSLQPDALMAALKPDVGVVGEAEWTAPQVVAALLEGRRNRRLVRSTSLLKRDPACAPTLAPDALLDALAPPARDLVDPRYYAFDGVDNVQTKRGCAFACAYCDYPDLEGSIVRVRDPERVADEIASRASAHGVTHVFIVDSVFNVPRWHAMAICNALIARGSPVPWVCYASPVGLDDALLRTMAAAGCVGIEVGTDAGTAAGLARLRKPFRLDDVHAAHARCRDHGIFDCHTFVLGALEETVDQARETLAFVDRLDPDVAVFLVFVEDREALGTHAAPHRAAILDLLAHEAPLHSGWSVPELGIRFGEKVTRFAHRHGLRGPAWTHLAAARQHSRAGRSSRDANRSPFAFRARDA